MTTSPTPGSGPSPRPPIHVDPKKYFYTPKKVSVQYTPEVGKKIFEAGADWFHPGTTINNLFDVTGKSQDEIFDIVKGLDSRVLQGAPQEILDLIKSGDIAHIFTTDPTESGGFADLASHKQEEVKKLSGSVYFRDKKGRTARWKLPEIASNDAGWNATKGGDIFSLQSVYGDDDFAKSLAKREALAKRVVRGQIAVENVHPELIQTGVIGDIVKGEENLIAFGDVLTGAEADQAKSIHYPNHKRTPTPTVTTGPTPGPVPPTPTVTTGPTPGSVPPTPTVTTGPTPGSVPPTPTVTTGPTPGSVPPTPTVTTGETPGRKPVGRPVSTVNTPPPPPTTTGARETAEKVTKSGNATPPPKATIHSNTPTAPRPSSGAPAKAPGRLRTAADDISAAVTQGPNGARNLKMLGIAGALGLAGFGLSRSGRSSQDENETMRRLEMQRRGII